MPAPSITEVRIRLADPNPYGIVGFASCLLNGELRLNDLTLFCEGTRGIVVRYPIRKAHSGKKYPTFLPLRLELAQAIESAVRSTFVTVCRGVVREADGLSSPPRSVTQPPRYHSQNKGGVLS